MHLINYITPCIFGKGSITRLGEEMNRINITSPLIITDAGILKAGIMSRVSPHLNNYALFDETSENPTEENLLKALKNSK